MKSVRIILALLLLASAFACDDLDPTDDPVAKTDPAAQMIKPQSKLPPSHLQQRVEREQIAVCHRPYGMTLSPDGRTLFVACPGENRIAAIDTELMELRWTSDTTCERVYELVADPRRNLVYAIAMSGRLLHVFDGKTGKLKKQLYIGRNVADMALVPGHDRMVVTAAEPAQAALIDLAELNIEGYVEFPTPPGSLAMRADGQLAAASGGLWQITVAGAKPMKEPVYLFDPLKPGHTRDQLGLGGTQARKGIFARGGSTLLVPGRQSATVSVFDVDQRRLARTVQVGAAPEKLVISSDGLWAFTLDSRGSSTTRIDLSRREASGHVVLPANPQDLMISPDGFELYAALPGRRGKRGEIAVVDMRALVVADRIPVGDDPCRMVVSHAGRRLFVSNFLADSVSVLE